MGIPIAWAADVGQSYFAPLVIFPLLVGVGLGAVTVGMMRLAQVGNRPTIVLGTVLGAAVAVAGQHYLDYRTAYDRAERETEVYRQMKRAFPDGVQGQMPAPPEGLADFLHRQAAAGRPIDLPQGRVHLEGWVVWLSWAIDGLLVLAAALALVIPATRQPYCNRCRSWYRVVRGGRIDAVTARAVALVASVAIVERAKAARFRLFDCNGGCGPIGFQLSWDESPRGTSTVRTWLDADRRDRIVQRLDTAKHRRDDPQPSSSPSPFSKTP